MNLFSLLFLTASTLPYFVTSYSTAVRTYPPVILCPSDFVRRTNPSTKKLTAITKSISKLYFSNESPSTPSTSTKDSTRDVNYNNELAESKDNKSEQKLQLSFELLKPFLKIAVPFFKEDKVARNSLIAVAALTLLNSGISVAFSYISRDFYNALNARDEPVFYEKIELFFLALVVAVPGTVYYRFVISKLSIYWREALTAKVLDKYFDKRTYYIMETLKDVDNPDQRISSDVRHFTSSSLDFFITIFTSIIDLLSFSAILFDIYPGLFLAIIIYAGLGSLITTNLGSELLGLNYDKIQREANFRFSLFRVRENVESIAFYDAKAVSELENIWELFQQALETQLSIVKVQRNLEFFTTSYRYIVQILPSLIVAPLYFAKKVELGAVSQSYGAFNHILSDFSIIINQFESISKFSAGLIRLTDFIDRIDSENGWDADLSQKKDGVVNVEKESDYVEDDGTILSIERQVQSSIERDRKKPIISMVLTPLQNHDMNNGLAPTFMEKRVALLHCSNLTVLTPDASRIVVGGLIGGSSYEGIRGIDWTLYKGDKILVVGASGAGKSSLVRSIAGLWQVGYGTINWRSSNSDEKGIETAPKKVFFLPQKPYNVIGTLRDQIMYPNIRSEDFDGGFTVGHDINHQSPVASDSKAMMKRVGGRTSTQRVLNANPLALLDSAVPSSNTNVSSFDSSKEESDDYFLDLLRLVKLENLAIRMGEGDAYLGLKTVKDWSKVLSLGEQQRLAFARVLFNRPAVVVLDEATSAMDLKTEAAMYSLLNTYDFSANTTAAIPSHLPKNSLTYISVGHRPTLMRYHATKLVLNGAGYPPRVEDIQGMDFEDLVDMTVQSSSNLKSSPSTVI